MSSSIDLLQPILDDGRIRSINFFNGRLLTGSDLTRERAAHREVDLRLGQAVGDGIAYGFEVDVAEADAARTGPAITVQPGLAINRRGQTLRLINNVNVALVRQPDSSAGVTRAFNECLPLETGTYVAGAGVYLLTVAPAETTEGFATTAGLETGTASCNTDTLVSALQFRLIQLNPPLTDAELRDESHLRNVLAYKCFGGADFNSYVADPFGTELTSYGLLDRLRPNRLTDCDVPLAVLYWTLAGGIKFIDMWSVRRRLTPQSSAGRSTTCVGDRRMSEGEAMFLQFQEQLEVLAAQANPQTLVAKQHFKYLPPVGAIPHEDTLSGEGLDYRVFFSGLTYREPVHVEGARVEQLVRRCSAYPPTDLNTGEMVWLYWVAQNMITLDKNPARPPRAYLMFTSGHVPYQGQAQYDLAHWDYGNYAI